MTDSEFREWLQYHTARFTSVGAQMRKLPAESTDARASALETADAWRRTLWNIELDDAKAATDALGRGEYGDRKVFFDDVPTVIRRLAEQVGRAKKVSSRTQYHDGEKAVRCLMCQDEGHVSIVHPNTIRDIARELRGQTALHGFASRVYSCSCACPCQAGDPHRKSVRGKQSPTFTYREGRDLLEGELAGLTNTEERAKITEWVRERMAPKKHDEFAEHAL